ncbi:hypothetical protein PX699_28420 [Sphingobium sp. H39-3-25]|nr:hypothetical protein [Sphingobium arseniciresistens]
MPYRIVHTNLRKPDIRENPKLVARRIREFGRNAIIPNAGGIVAFYPTKLEYQYCDPFMRPDQDFVRDMIDADRAEGLVMIERSSTR